MSYATYDFHETLAGAGITREDVKHVHAAWGDQGDYSEWSGGFLLELKDGRWAYLTGWCDTTGWGCQDGTDHKFYDARPDLPTEKSEWDKTPIEWDTDPADLNRYVRGEIDKFA